MQKKKSSEYRICVKFVLDLCLIRVFDFNHYVRSGKLILFLGGS